jgi:putative nucleotidyltransferase with HDIG domain
MKDFLKTYSKNISTMLLVLASLLLVVYMLPKRASFKYDFQIGKPWKHDNLLAPFDFAILKSNDVLSKEKEVIQQNFAPFYQFNNKALPQKLDHFKGKLAQEMHVDAPERNSDFLKKFQLGVRALTEVYTMGVVDMYPDHELRREQLVIQLIHGEIVEERALSAFYTLATAFIKMEEIVSLRITLANDSINMLALLEDELAYNVIYDKEKTEAQISQLIEKLSLTTGKVEKDEGVILRGEIVDQAKFRKINSLKEVYNKTIGETGNVWIGFGQGIIVLICLIAMLLFMSLFIQDLFTQFSKVSFLIICLLLAVLLTKAINELEVFSIYLVPLCIIPIVLKAFYDYRVALFVHLVILMVLGLLVSKPFEFLTMQGIAAMAVLFKLGQIKKRSQFFVSAAIVFVSYVVVYFAFTIIQDGGVSQIEYIDFAWLAGSAMLTLFAQPFIYMVEKLFGFVSETTLMEMADTNNILLRDLASKAPGTFQHTLQVANLAESCIQQIGGNALLIRAGALYHDIGKMKQPKFFIENQHNGLNPHNELSPEDSADIIIQHVRDGVALARKHGLPDMIIDFIKTHHGTTRTEYFYRKAKEKDPEISEDIFKYPGPAPTTREMSVLMMCDSVEAASRSLKEYSKETISNLVDGIIDHQMKLNQFNNADITFRDISVLKKVLKRKLLDIYHVRVEYPKEQ